MLELKHVSNTVNPGPEDAKTALDDLSLSVAGDDHSANPPPARRAHGGA